MKINKLYIIVALLGIVMTGCQKEEQLVPENKQREESVDSESWTLTVKTVVTRAMELNGSTLNVYWKDGEKAAVYFEGTRIGTLTVSGAVYNGTATLTGSVSKPVGLAVSSTLMVLFPGRDDEKWTYEGQDGSAPSETGTMATRFDYATASLTVSEVNDGAHTISVAAGAVFDQQQSVQRFGFLVGGSGDPIAVKSFTLSSDQNKIVRTRTYDAGWISNYGSVTMTPAGAVAGNLYYLSIRNENISNDDTYSFSVVGSNDALYVGTKLIPSSKLGYGKFLSTKTIEVNQKVLAPAPSGTITEEVQVL